MSVWFSITLLLECLSVLWLPNTITILSPCIGIWVLVSHTSRACEHRTQHRTALTQDEYRSKTSGSSSHGDGQWMKRDKHFPFLRKLHFFKMGLMKKGWAVFTWFKGIYGILKAHLNLQNKRFRFTSINGTNSQTGKKRNQSYEQKNKKTVKQRRSLNESFCGSLKLVHITICCVTNASPIMFTA